MSPDNVSEARIWSAMKEEVHPAKGLWAVHHPPEGYPSGIIPVPEPIKGRAFFPGGYGLWMDKEETKLPTFPVGGVMVLGHDFHSVSGYQTSWRLGYESLDMPTWKHLRRLLDTAGLPLKRCFFTNLYMGLRKGAATGKFPGANDPIFVRHCEAFLQHQIDIQRPSLLLTLGKYVPTVLGRLSPDLGSWAACRTFEQFDAIGAVRNCVRFNNVENFTTTVIVLTHPSLRPVNVPRRNFGGLQGDEAEVTMLRRACSSILNKDPQE